MTIFATFRVDVADIVDLGQTAIGHRRMVPITGGTVSGFMGDGIVLSGADWQWVQADGSITLDAHYLIKLNSGELVEVQSNGTRFTSSTGEVVFRTAIRMITTASRPDINQAMFIGNGQRLANQVILELRRVD
jgi:hypothetical protein